MRARAIQGLIWSREADSPWGTASRQPRGKKGYGVRYERELAKALPDARHGQWFQFQDSAGPGHCQTDLLLDTPMGLAILEAKYTWTQEGHWQVERLYKPVVERATRRSAFGLVVCRVLLPELRREVICSELEPALLRAAAGLRTVLHWTGQRLGTPCLQPCQASLEPTHLAASLASL